MGTICIYHANCLDGFASAYAVWKALGDEATYVPALYGDAAPDCAGRDVVMVDYTYPRPMLEQIAASASSLVVLDHHDTARRALAGILQATTRICADQSACKISWEYFHDSPPPDYFSAIENYDLGRPADDAIEVSLSLQARERSFANWDRFTLSDLLRDGRVIRPFFDAKCAETMLGTKRGLIAGRDVPVCHAPVFMADAIGRALAPGEQFAAVVWHNSVCENVSLRSHSGGADVSVIAESFGGGGSYHSAAFRRQGQTYRV